MRISDWSSDVCSSDLLPADVIGVSLDGQSWVTLPELAGHNSFEQLIAATHVHYRNVHNNRQRIDISSLQGEVDRQKSYLQRKAEIESKADVNKNESLRRIRSEEHTSELQSLMRNS